MLRIVIASLFVVACGKSAEKQAEKQTEKQAESPAEKHEEHEGLSPELSKFHDVLAPRWHAPQSPERMKNTCDAIIDFKTLAAANVTAVKGDAQSPDGKAARDLVDAVNALEAACEAKDATKFEVAFKDVHESFHRAMEASHK